MTPLWWVWNASFSSSRRSEKRGMSVPVGLRKSLTPVELFALTPRSLDESEGGRVGLRCPEIVGLSTLLLCLSCWSNEWEYSRISRPGSIRWLLGGVAERERERERELKSCGSDPSSRGVRDLDRLLVVGWPADRTTGSQRPPGLSGEEMGVRRGRSSLSDSESYSSEGPRASGGGGRVFAPKRRGRRVRKTAR